MTLGSNDRITNIILDTSHREQLGVPEDSSPTVQYHPL